MSAGTPNRRVPAGPILFEGLQCDPIEIASELARERRQVGVTTRRDVA